MRVSILRKHAAARSVQVPVGEQQVASVRWRAHGTRLQFEKTRNALNQITRPVPLVACVMDVFHGEKSVKPAKETFHEGFRGASVRTKLQQSLAPSVQREKF